MIMHLGKPLTRSLRGVILLSVLSMSTALAAPRAPRSRGRNECVAQIKQFIQQNNLPSHERNGVLYFALNKSGFQMKEDYLRACGPNTVEFFKEPRHGTYHHLYTRVGETTWSRIWGLGKSSWRQPSQALGVLVEFSPGEMQRLNAFMEHNNRSPNSPHRYGNIGDFNVGGGGGNTTHCTNYLSRAKIGDHGESLPQVLGQWGTGIAPSWISSLMRSGNARVLGVVVHDQGLRELTPNTDLSHFFN
jgi:hypothetical protein